MKKRRKKENSCTNSNKNLLRILKLTLKKNKFKLLSAFIIVVIIAISSLLVPQITKLIIDKGIQKMNISILVKLTIVYITIKIIIALLDVLLSYLYSIIKSRVTVQLKVKLLNHLSKLSGRYYSDIKTGNLLSIIESDMYMIENFGAELIFNLILDFVTAIVSFIFLVKIQLDLFLIVCFFQVLLIVLQKNISKLIGKMTSYLRDNNGNLSNIIQEYVNNIMNVVISKSKRKFFSSYLKQEKNLIDKEIKLDLVISGNISMSIIFTSLITIAIYSYGGYKIIKGYMSFGELIAFEQYTSMLIGPCMSIIRANTRIEQAKVSINRVFSIIDEDIEIAVDNNAIRLENKNINIIEFKNVEFKYNDEKNNILDKINLNFKKGEITAIVGRSGSGKSTIINLLYRFWDIDKGKILIDNIDLKNINLLSLRKKINILTQDLLIFDDTIRNNITLNVDISEEKLKKIIFAVELDSLIEKLEDGVHTIVGEKGIKISGGQKQKIAIARALLSDSPILIFDEATSALDNISQNRILKNINSYIKDKIVIIIAHRISTIKDADKIYVLEKGKVIEEGIEKDLIKNDGVYKKLAQSSI
ncbi:MAG: ABC transporter ATP-binding protein/permease [Clostridioides sp.]|jgi:ABC-type multidrug transport system fused ATPase/permease subunit|nr:ABC transporter ATP-binding protein/permease [Clostridioides sp.]